MKKNIGILDKIIRVSIALLIIVLLYFKLFVGELMANILSFVAGILLITSLIDFCPIYLVLNIGTKKQ
jgi:zinc transporter ZupT